MALDSRGSQILWRDVETLRVVQAVGRQLRDTLDLQLGFLEPDGGWRAVDGDGRRPSGSLPERSTEGGRRVTQLRAQMTAELRRMAEGGAAAIGNGSAAALVALWRWDGRHVLAAPLLFDGRFWGAVVALSVTVAADFASGDSPAKPELIATLSQAPQAVRSGPLFRVYGERAKVLCAMLSLVADEVALFKREMDRRERRLGRLRGQSTNDYGEIVGQSAAMGELFHTLDKVVSSESTVLIEGENGTGKELVARAIHRNSVRSEKHFIVQNCSALNDNLLDSELFGHVKGAFTGAVTDKRGLFEMAHGGSFFLDEVGEMSPALQVKLLRVLQEGTFLPVGSTDSRRVDVRIVAATNRDLWQMVEKGDFREDLYYRLNVIRLRIPPLRERKDDISLLAEHFLRLQSDGRQVGAKRLSERCLKRMMEYDWPGNVRELENEIERLVVLADREVEIEESLLSPRILDRSHEALLRTEDRRGSMPEAVETLEKAMITEALRRARWNKSRAAKELKVSRRNLIRKVQKYDLDRRKR
jgi:transcriptional regulator with GAF, ATPase, and Fis domain